MSSLPPANYEPAILTAGEFGAAITTIMPVLIRYARRLAQTAADTDDLVQDTLLKALAARTSFRAGTNLRAWLQRIARNTFLSARRRGARQILWEPDEIARALVTGIEQEDAVMLSDLTSAVAALPEPQRRAFEMVAVEGLSYGDAATRLDVELGTLKSRVARARTALVRTMETLPQRRFADPRRQADAPVRQAAYAKWKAAGGGMIGGSHERAAA